MTKKGNITLKKMLCLYRATLVRYIFSFTRLEKYPDIIHSLCIAVVIVNISPTWLVSLFWGVSQFIRDKSHTHMSYVHYEQMVLSDKKWKCAQPGEYIFAHPAQHNYIFFPESL